MMRDKLGLFGEDKNDLELINNLLNWMKTNQADYTNTFCYLMNIGSIKNEIYKDKNFINWFKNWEKRFLINGSSKENSLELMKKNNPIVIPRNHKVEEAIEAANNDNLKPMNDLLSILNKPYSAQSNIESFQSSSNDQNYQTFCGT
jgi:uncharacterized protein YdiU (UPF0061 family)